MQKAVQEKLARAHYENAALYEQRYKRRRIDVIFYLHWGKSPCLELGAGSGRITQRLLAQGVNVTALEREPALRKLLEQRCPNARVIAGDMRRVELREKFRAVLAPFHTLNHIYDWRELFKLFTKIHGWLAPGGVLAFDVPLPDLYLLSRSRHYTLGHASIDGVRYRYSESFDYDQKTQIETIVAHYESRQGGFDLPLLHRHYFPQELSALLGAAGFSIVQHAGDFSGAELNGDSEEQVIVARKC